MAGTDTENTDLPKLSKENLIAVGRMIESRFAKYRKDRRHAEVQWLKNLRQVLGEYEPEFLSTLGNHQSRAYPKITRVKCVSMVSRLMSLLFPLSEKNWTLSPSRSPSLGKEQLTAAVEEWKVQNSDVPLSNEAIQQAVSQYARKCASNMEREIEDQLQDVGDYGAADYAALARKVVESAVKYSVGVLKGPMTLESAEATYALNEAGEIVIEEGKAYRPYFEHVSVWDYYPDMTAKTFAQMEGQFQRHVFSRHQLRALAKRSDFIGDEITDYIRENPNGNHNDETYETELRALGDHREAKPEGGSKYDVIEYWGNVSGKELSEVGVNVAEGDFTTEVRATLWVLAGRVIKAQKDPFPMGTKMYHQFVFEEDDVNLCGSGLPPIVRDSQMAVANGSRMMLDNAASVCGPNIAVDYNQMYKGQDLTSVSPFKVWLTETNPNSSRDPVKSISFDAHISELSSVIEQFKNFADAETFVGPMTGGDMSNVPGEAVRTTGSMSMMMGSAALPFRDIVRNFDRFTVSVIHALVQWNREFNSKPDLDGDMRPIARGATSLMAKELRAAAMDSLAQSLSPEDEVYIDRRVLIKHRITARDLPSDELLVPDNVVEKRLNEKAEQAKREQEKQDALFAAALATQTADTLKSNSQAQRNLDVGDTQVARLVLDAIEKGVDPDVITSYTAAAQPAQPQGNPGGAAVPGVPPAAAGQPQGAVT